MNSKEKIAVVGIGGVFPGVKDLDHFWKVVKEGKNTCKEVPTDRWRFPSESLTSSTTKPDHVITNRGFFVDDLTFDPRGLNIDKELLNQLDPLFHLTLKAGKEAFDDCQSEKINRDKTGVIFGNIILPTEKSSALAREYLLQTFEEELFNKIDYEKHSSYQDRIKLQTKPLNHYASSLPASILAKALGLSGSTYTLDAACASSLYALKLACDELLSHRMDAMITGGVSRPDCLYTQMGFTQLQALSKSGISRPFDDNGDGLVVGEGAGLLVIKRLSDAIAHNDRIYAVIEGIGLSSDLGGTLMAPKSEGQLRAMRKAYEVANLSPADIDLVECHATGTPVGDKEEIKSLSSLWQETEGHTDEKCVLGSVKSNIGHLLTAAGASSLIKAILALKNKSFPPTANFNSSKNLQENGAEHFEILKEERHWPKRENAPRRAAINGFGFGGINAHVILSEWNNSTNDHPALIKEKPTPKKEVAIVGVAIESPDFDNIQGFSEFIKDQKSAQPNRNPKLFGADKSKWFQNDYGEEKPAINSINSLDFPFFEYRIPPNEARQILPQQLLMLKVVKRALNDAQYEKVSDLNAGVYVGVGLDGNANLFNCRWELRDLVEKWACHFKMGITEEQKEEWLEELKNELWPSLNANRTIGYLGAITASRLAKEFGFSASGFTISGEENSGIRALEVAYNAISNGEIDMALVGGVDFTTGLLNTLAHTKVIKDNFPNALKTTKSDMGIAFVLKDLVQAIKDNNNIYGTIDGISSSFSSKNPSLTIEPKFYKDSYEKAIKERNIKLDHLIFQEVDTSSLFEKESIVKELFSQLLPNKIDRTSKSLSQQVGYCGVTSGLLGAMKALINLKDANDSERDTKFYGSVSTAALDGNITHLFLQSYPSTQGTRPPKAATSKRKLNIEPLKIKVGKEQFKISIPKGIILQDQKGKSKDKSNRIKPNFDERRLNRENLKEASINLPANMDQHSQFFSPIYNELLKTETEVTLTHKAHLENSTQAISILGSIIERQMRQAHLAPHTDLSRSKEEISKKEDSINSFQKTQDKITSTAKKANTSSHVVATKEKKGLKSKKKPVLDYEQCREFARGKIGNVLGPKFQEIDNYKTRVRLPDGPLLLCHRIIEIDAEALSMTKGRLVTEHDVLPNAWYLEDGQMPVSVAVESGQADLFLSAYLGIDFITKGNAVYRLLDAVVTFHSNLPIVGDTISYDIKIHNFFSHGDTTLFRFEFEATYNGETLMSMKGGIAGFFSDEELENGKGIVKTSLDHNVNLGKFTGGFTPLVPMEKESYTDDQLSALRRSDYMGCFGYRFANLPLNSPKSIPGGKMRLVDRILELNPKGGHYGLGYIRGEADIYPDDWFLTCHFVDDMVMPGTLMYECCFHTFRIFLMRMGVVGEKDELRYEPIKGKSSQLKCRGQVRAHTKKVIYEILPKEIGYNPDFYAIADANMYADGKHIVEIKNITIYTPGFTKEKLESIWGGSLPVETSFRQANLPIDPKTFSRDEIIDFTTKNPSMIFGERFLPFDNNERFIARLPKEPFLLIDRVNITSASLGKLRKDSKLSADYNLKPNEWFFEANDSALVPYSILLEIALQPCGFLAAYMGSALTSKKDLFFRNLQGHGSMVNPIDQNSGKLTTNVEVQNITKSNDMILLTYKFQVVAQNKEVFSGETGFGFFTKEALENGSGLEESIISRQAEEKGVGAPLDYSIDVSPPLLMFNDLDCINLNGGKNKLGYISGSKTVDPNEWFFKAHFYQDPVMPGSLGVEAFIQLLKVLAKAKWPDCADIIPLSSNKEHSWIYRGQVTPENKKVFVESQITEIDLVKKEITADGQLYVDGMLIYQMKSFTLKVR